ncbi:tetratricopeptide repeat protein [Fibrobacter sp.]|uniref:tetratricopeptide repeat protein n=1 Tax=Fibrobacter sp. TaxID=35828 RepID=UPI0038699DCD
MAVTLDSLKKTIGKKNVNSRAFAWLADLEREAGNLDQALQRVDGGLTLYPNDVAAMLVRSKILFQKESYDACIEECEKVLVADPFNLAAQQIMGDAYDKLENIGERNVCYRRLHDMDPLNTFWKDEYDVVVGAAAAAAMAGEISDTDFSMPDVGNMDLSDEFTAAPAAESTEAAPADEFSLNEPQAAEADASAADVAEPAGDDPFAALASMIPGNDDADDSAMEDLSASLNSAMDSINNESAADKPLEELSEDENISSSDVGSALSDMFGLEDDLEPEEASAPAAEASSDIPASIDDNAEANAASVFGAAAPEAPAEDKPQSIDDAFGDIFGEDELPEEKPQQASIDAPADEPAPEALATEEAPAEDKPQSIDDAFGDIFGEDELPEEKPQASIDAPAEPAADIAAEEPAAEPADIAAEPAADFTADLSDDLELPSEDGGLFEKSAAADMNLTADEVAEPAAETKADEPTTIDNAFDSIFGEDELPEEKPQSASIDAPAEEAAADAAAEPAADFTADLSDDLELPSEEGGLFEKSADADMNLTGDWTPGGAPVEDAPAEEAAAEETAEEIAPVAEEAAPATASDAGFSVDNAFDSLFGSDDDLPEEKPQAEAETLAEAPAAEESVSLAEQVDKAEAELEMPEVKPEESDLAKEMGGAFASMFGNDDDDLDLPAAKTETASEPLSNDQEATGAAIEESFGNISEESLSKDLDNSFDSLFGKDEAADDSLALDESHSPAAEAAPAEETFAAAPADAPKDLDSLESEVSGAFKGLFDMDDDSLTEEDKPSNKGVDFLMSGDSDDEISAGLINNPDAPLDRGAYDLDESLNTPTLAEIYFDQGKYGKALEIYKDLAQKEPDNEEIAKRKDEIEKLYNEKFGGNA